MRGLLAFEDVATWILVVVGDIDIEDVVAIPCLGFVLVAAEKQILHLVRRKAEYEQVET